MPNKNARSYIIRRRSRPHTSKRNVMIAMAIIVLAVIVLLLLLPKTGAGSATTSGGGMTQSIDSSLDAMLE